jgi:hypothetical protein
VFTAIISDKKTKSTIRTPRTNFIIKLVRFDYRKFGLKPRPLRTALSYNGKSDNQAKN